MGVPQEPTSLRSGLVLAAFLLSKNPETISGTLEKNKYDPVVRKHVPYREAEI